MTIADLGFLSPNINDHIPLIRLSAREWFDLADHLNRVGQEALNQLEPRKSVKAQFGAAAFLPRLISTFQGTVLVAERGMAVEAATLARACLETCFMLGALLADPALIDRMIDAEQHRIKVGIKVLLSAEHIAHLTPEQISATETRIIELADSKKFKISDAADKAGFKNIYDVMYRQLSGDAHPTFGSLERYVEQNSHGEITGIRYGPSTNDLENALSSAAFSMLIGLDAVTRICEDNRIELKLQELSGRYNSLLSRANG